MGADDNEQPRVRRGPRPPTLRTVIAAVVTLIWATAYVVSIFDPRFRPDPSITSVMVLVVAYLFVTHERDQRIRRNGNGNGGGGNAGR